MTADRSSRMGSREGLLGWFDRVRFNEALRQGLGLLLVAACAYFSQPDGALVSVGLSIALLGQILRVYAAGFIFKNKELATSGPYALVRHPLYLGNILILGGFGLASSNLYLWVVLLAFFLVWYPAAVAYEDKKLEKLFGAEWLDWSRDAHALVPRSFRWADLKGNGWDTYQSLIRNGELPISLYLLSCGIWLWVVTHAS